MKNILKFFNKQVFICTFIIWIILNITGIQNMFFQSDDFILTITIKAIHFIFLYSIVAKIQSLYKNRKTPKVKNEIIISIIYFVILISLLLMVWPGTWSWDDIDVLTSASWFELTPWQHFFSGLFMTLCLQTIPIPSGVIIMQILISALIVGYCLSNIGELYGKTKKQKIIIQVIVGLFTLFPPLILYILSGFRMGIYSFLELLLITKMLVLYKEGKKITPVEIVKISLITIIISCWRTEGIYYSIFILILYLILGKKIITKKTAIISFGIIMCINLLVIKINNLMIGDNDYSITATMEPVAALIKNSDETDKKELDAIDKIVDIEYILENPDETGELYFWEKDVVQKDYTEEEYSNYLKAYAKLAIKYPGVTLKSMWNIFLRSGSGFGENSKQTTHNMVANTGGKTLELFEVGKITGRNWNRVPSADFTVKLPINEKLREKVILFLNGSDADKNLTIIHNIFWNLFIPFTLILICLIYKLIKKDWFMIFLILTVIARIPIVFATAPAAYFMYYLSAYLCTYILSAIIIIEVIISIKNKKKIGGLLCEKKY